MDYVFDWFCFVSEKEIDLSSRILMHDVLCDWIMFILWKLLLYNLIDYIHKS